ncbi:uncharacterized protein LOC143288779 [Babylonia areolata]|uniref:uncharacterized protein LOC143288779 n=1 Tax=Babylonia areolata TaxID=304850 RepID=UPI003FD0508D
MSTRVLRRTRHPLETLERMLQKTTLTTQRLTHQNIMNIGSNLLTVTESDDREDKQKAIDDAVSAAEARATRELRAALKRLQEEKDGERQRALAKQEWYNERQAQRVSEQRDRAEEEHLKDLRRKLTQEKDEALAAQWEEAQRLQQEAVALACGALRTQLRREFEEEKAAAIAEALREAEEAFKRREEEVRARTRQQCQEEARREAERTAKLHQAEVERLSQKYKVLEQKFRKELDHKERVEKDFRGLQEDYRRFMDYTDGRFHSDYLMKLRHVGMALAHKRLSLVVHDDDVQQQLPAL